ncbi:RNase adapter RapZ [Arenimonas malthae]|uniref:RNase adapter RapZ n=1 Tax=Arenimonas malthae TaxID=354197 RepID=UPI0009FE747D|nr:RNase adapter RapZ [Arenimonas malthae]
MVVTGLSGSGKSVALKTLEDLDVYCTDNLPVELLPEFVKSVAGDGRNMARMAVGIDVRNASDLARIPEWLSAVGSLGFDYKLVFFDTRDEVLLKRYSDTRRKHPLSHGGLALADAIELERLRLRPLQAIADLVMDTSEMNVHQMRRQVTTAVGVGTTRGMSLLFESFAYKRGLPADADFVFDARALPNPHWDARLRPLSGRDAAVREHLDQDPVVQEFVAHVQAFLENWVPRFEAETRSYLTIAFGCTGGRHRSVYLAERLAAHCRSHGREGVLTFHRELE